MKCPVCEAKNPQGFITCNHCGSDLYTVLLEQVSTRQLASNRQRAIPQSLTMPSSNPVVVYIRDADEPLAISRSGTFTFGRQDETIEADLDIDLNMYGADDLGVSRLHATLDTAASPPTLKDLDSFNGTFINGQRLVAQQIYYLQSSDEIRLGRMVLRVFYDR